MPRSTAKRQEECYTSGMDWGRGRKAGKRPARQPATRQIATREDYRRLAEELPHLDLLKGDRKALKDAVALRVHTLTGIKPEFRAVAFFEKKTPFGVSRGLSTADLLLRAEKYSLIMCKYCAAHRNLRIEKGLVVEFFCASCRRRIAELDESTRCPNPAGNKKCLGEGWINALGGASKLCRECHGSPVRSDGSPGADSAAAAPDAASASEASEAPEAPEAP